MLLVVLCIFILSGILVAGLSPFYDPRNAVAWSGNRNGIRFGDHGSILSSGAFTISGSQGGGCSLEIWLEPGAVDGSSTVLAFYNPKNPLYFSIQQDRADMRLQRETKQQHRTTMDLKGFFRKRMPVFITITSGPFGTSVYADGVLVRTSSDARLSAVDLSGQLVVGTSPVVDSSWSGEFRGLAIYNQELTAGQVLHHYETWTKRGRPEGSGSERTVALYLFAEHRGDVVHNQLSSGINLRIPERYAILHEKFLEPPWKEFYVGWDYWKNVFVNIGGFIPLGFFFCAYWSSIWRMRKAALVTIIFGATVSLTIEVGQAYLPTRNSGMTDLITNTLGTYLGVVLYRWNPTLIHTSLNRILSAALR